METTREHRERTVESGSDRTWSPAQVVAGLIGLGFVVIGAVALLRVGFSDLLATAEVGWYTHTGILGIFEVVLGLLFLSAAASAIEVRTSSISLGVVLIAVALVALIEPEGMSRWVGDAREVGLTYLVAGLVAAAAGALSPVIVSRRHRRYDTSTR